MNPNILRRRTLLTLAAMPMMPACAAPGAGRALLGRFAELEKELQGRIGVSAIDTGSGKLVTHRADERFAMCSTFKMMASAAVLSRSVGEPELLGRRIRYTKSDLVTYSPVTAQHLDDGMTLEQLCAAAVTVSDNAAANLILDQIGGPAGLTRFARTLGDQAFRLDRRETELNTSLPGDPRDTTTPRAMMASLRALVLGNSLPPPQRQKLKDWLIGCETGSKTIRAGVPVGWMVGDKTGSGGYGSRNDVGIIWPPGRAPIVLAIYTVREKKGSSARDDIVAAAAANVVAAI